MIMLHAHNLQKTFVLHLQNKAHLPVLKGGSITAKAQSCTAITGPSGAGKTTFLRALYGNYLVDDGEILINHRGTEIDIAKALPEQILAIRRETLGYVTQFLRAMPRVSTLEIVAAPLLERGEDYNNAIEKAASILIRLNVPARMHNLPPITFSGGEQQRVNLARAFVCDWPILLLDEPTASLDPTNRDIVIALMNEVKSRGTALIGIFHDQFVRDAVADAELQLKPLKEDA